MKFNENQIATYLLCAQLPKTKTIPLTIIEWNTLVLGLTKNKLEPQIVTTITSSELSHILIEAKPVQRTNIIKKIEARRQLGLSMFEMENVINQGVKILFRSHMPKSLKRLTSKYLPPFFYCTGDLSIFEYPILGVVGARNATEEELKATIKIGEDAAAQGVVIASGGARGIDSSAVEAYLRQGGKAIVFPADGLQKWLKKKEIRNFIESEQLLLLSAQRIEAPFSGAYAMQRNKYIHVSGHAVLVASSSISRKEKRSGTWEGVIENVQGNWTPIFTIGQSEGVQKLISEEKAQAFESIVTFLNSCNEKEVVNYDFEEHCEQLIFNALKNNIEPGYIKKYVEQLIEKSVSSSTIGQNNKTKEMEQLRLL
ncbi:DNA-processing protein DprA [Sporosarcina sp. FSL K6-5500]|uniref:DNA-processing protein DprA n=1 Tax=Sporosarcina sp. FSL K6-5500 TaxID=2921558 RepID=UPI0030FBA809